MRLRLRLALTIAITTAITLGVAFAAVFWTYTGVLQRRLDETLLDVARSEAAEAPANGFRFSTRPGPAASDVGPLDTYGVIYDEGGNVLASTEPFATNPPPRTEVERTPGAPFDFHYARMNLRAVVVTVPASPGRLVLLAMPRDEIDGDVRSLVRGMLLALAVALPWASFVAYWIGGRLTRDHAAIADVARAVARGDLSVRVASRSPDPEIAQLARDIDEMVERLSESMTSQERFVANAAHELRAPLTALYGELQQALRRDRSAPEYRTAIAQALEEAKRLRAVADDLLVIAGARHDAAFTPEPRPLLGALSEARTLVDRPAADRGVSFDISGSTSVVVEDRNGDLTRLFRNLFENGVRHSPDGAVIQVRVHAGARVRVTVRDGGDGIPDADRPYVFEPFFRGAQGKRDRGTGLGLAIAREIARARGGDIVLEQRSGRSGAAFVVDLPRAEGNSTELTASVSPSSARGAPALARRS